jgi:sulfate transport system substrate-binding protein
LLAWRTSWTNAAAIAAVVACALLVVVKNLGAQGDPGQFLNVSYDPTRELYRDLNVAFVAAYEKRTGRRVAIQQSHGGSSRQARAVIDGAPADVVTLAGYPDIDALRRRGLIADAWSGRLPNDSVPYTSTIVFVVRKGNPRAIHDFADLVGPDLTIVTPNPKTSGNGRLAFLAAWGSVVHRGGTEQEARAFVTKLYGHVAVLDDGARDATIHFSQEKIGDVHLTWENEAILEVDESGGELETVYPPASLRAEPCVAWVDANVQRKGTEALAKAYLEFLYTEEGQDLIARHGYRPISAETMLRHRARFPALDLFPITTIATDWNDAQVKFFGDNGVFDAIYKPRP